MKKSLFLFLLFLSLFLLASVTYRIYCHAKPEGCKKVKWEKEDETPSKGIEW